MLSLNWNWCASDMEGVGACMDPRHFVAAALFLPALDTRKVNGPHTRLRGKSGGNRGAEAVRCGSPSALLRKTWQQR